jgi:hypothetical protein
MSEFADLRSELTGTRSARAEAASELAIARERLRDARSEMARLQRVPGEQQQRRLAALQEQAGELEELAAALRERVGGLAAGAHDLVGRLAELADPAEQIEELDDRTPILLFPLRLETRFRPGPEGGRRLAIRIYPDDCQVDSFEELLSATEVENARRFWAAMWRAGRDEGQERGAWRALVGGVGSGRAAYLIEQYRPAETDLAGRPAKIDPQDVILVIVPDLAVTDAERDAAFEYHVAVWRADGDAAAEDAALNALKARVGAARAEELREDFAPEPIGLEPPIPYTRADVRASCALLRLPATPPTKTTAWTQGPKAFALPDRFVALLYADGQAVARAVGSPVRDGLAVGPDPSLPPDEQIKMEGDDLVLNEDLRWLADFGYAVDVGMGIEVPLSEEQARTGFDRLLVVGVRFASDERDGRALLETLIAHQASSRGGFGLVPQGSPTNNTSSGGAGYTWVDDADASYDVIFKGKDAYPESADPFLRRDGQWLAEALGIDGALLKRVPHAGGSDQAEARAMNLALWPATLGYQLEEMLAPLVSPDEVAATRAFFARYVSGRGPLPSIRVGQQPYGILPALAFSRYRATRRPSPETDFAPALATVGPQFLQRLHGLLMRLDADWRAMAGGVAHVGQPGEDAHQTLLDIIGLHSGSVEYHQRYAASFEQLYNKLVLELGSFWGSLLAGWLRQRSRALLAELGADPEARPPILEKFFYGESPLLTGPIVDDAPLSESAAIRAYPDGRNYIDWLATSSLDVIRRQDFGGQPAPTALLYLMLRHAMMLGHWDAGTRFLERRTQLAAAELRREPAFINVQTGPDAGQSKLRHLSDIQPDITGDETTTLGEYILLPSVLARAPETQDLREVIAALDLLADAPTARLERAFAEHVDCCTYRLDAWKAGIAATRLEELRAQGIEGPAPGIFLGAFGWLEDVRPRPAKPEPVTLEGDLAEAFARPGDVPLVHDPANAGHIHGPSLNHAATAAILKNAYRVNASPANPDAMAVNLSSRRVRQALDVLEGMRNGQTLGALLGYRIERGLHDNHALAEVDKFIYPLRQVFPLVANQLQSTADLDAEITQVEARNVIDGLKLVTRARTPGQGAYSFGFPTGTAPGQLPQATQQEREAIDAEVDALLALHDAVADLVMAESVYQVVLGNFDRAAANTNAFSKGARPPEVQVVDTPRPGRSLTHRVALHLDPDADPLVSPSTVAMTPRAKADAPLNLWLAGCMPDPPDLLVRVTYDTPELPAPKTVTLSCADLGLQPIDIVRVVNLDLEQAMSELDDRIVQAIRYGPDAHPDVAVTIDYTEPIGGNVTVFQLAALVRSLRTLVLDSRHLGPTDMAMPLESTQEEAAWDDVELAGRVTEAIDALTDRRDELVVLETDTSDLDDYARKVSRAFLRAARHGVPQLGTGEIHGDIRAIYDAISEKVAAFVERWRQKDADYDALLAILPTLTTDAERIALLREAEGLIASSTTAEPPLDPNVYRTAVEANKAQFDVVLGQFDDLLTLAATKLVDFAAAAAAMTPLAAVHDATPFEIADQQAALSALRATLGARVASAAADLTTRIDDATAAVAATDLPPGSQARIEQLQGAARLVLGDEARLVPRFRLASDRALEFDQCVAGSAALLGDLETAGRRFPVDDWLYGLGRVREKLGAWEAATVLAEAFGAAPGELTPVQLPLRADDRWMALEFDTSVAAGDRLLYTAAFAVPFVPGDAQCGLLLDEWPEVVPAADVVSGVAFHYDRPGSQPAQAMLLALPSALTGRWSWNDLVAMLHETLDAAKARGVEPAQVDGSSYAQLLPATLMAVTLYQITIATNLGLNNGIYERI